MKILHCCLAAFYIDNYGYQENVITRLHKNMGHDVRILASTETFVKGNRLGYIKPSEYINEDGIKVVRLPYIKCLPHIIARKVRIYPRVKSVIEDFSPDVIFMHNPQTAAVFPVINYVRQHPGVKLYIDNHTDFVNSARSWLSKNILHGMLYKWYVHKTIPYTNKYYGVLPVRVKLLTDFYGTPKEKTEYLPMGVDDSKIDFSQREIIRCKVRKELDLDKDDFVIITGGKLDINKGIVELLKAFRRINNDKVKLLVFGSIQKDIEKLWTSAIGDDRRITYLGWISAQETYKYFFASDLACFPGTHSVLWEEAVGYGIPTVFKKWTGMDHVDRGGNCIFLDSISTDSLYTVLRALLTDKAKYGNLLENAIKPETMIFFAYSKIALRAID